MNIIQVSLLVELEKILLSVPFVGSQKEEIYHNTWYISLENDLIQLIKLQDLVHFVSKLVMTREHQLQSMKIANDVTFYMWFDKQALQLRFSLTSASPFSLPFQCKVHLLDTPDTILKSFIDTVQNVAQFGDVVEMLTIEDGDWDKDDDVEYTQNVFTKTFHLTLH